MKTYDFAFSCGFSCAVTQALRAANLQFASFPFDWTASPGFLRAAEIIAGDFAHWMDRPEDLQLVDIRRTGTNKHVYRNVVTGVGFVHDFSSFRTFEENFPREQEKYCRRIERFTSVLSKSRTALAIYAEWPIRPRVSREELLRVRETLVHRYPGTAFDLLYFHVVEGVHQPTVERDEDGIVEVALDYRTFVDGELNHVVETSGFLAYLKEHVRVPDTRTPEEAEAYRRDWLKQDHSRWGKGLWATLVNRTAYRIYRKLERFLMRQGLVPRERPMWFEARNPKK